MAGEKHGFKLPEKTQRIRVATFVTKMLAGVGLVKVNVVVEDGDSADLVWTDEENYRVLLPESFFKQTMSDQNLTLSELVAKIQSHPAPP